MVSNTVEPKQEPFHKMRQTLTHVFLISKETLIVNPTLEP